MAGSYNHIRGKDGGWSLIENMGDAHEAVEELLWLIESVMTPREAKRRLKTFHKMHHREMKPDKAFITIRKRMDT